MCGYDLTKEIFHRCGIFLSHGSVYPIVFSLEEEGMLCTELSDENKRTKKYSLASKGRQIAQKKQEEIPKAMETVSFLIKRDEYV